MSITTLKSALAIGVLLGCGLHNTYAKVYTLYNDTETVVGELSTTYSTEEDTLLDIARDNGLGFQDIKLFNPAIDTWLPGSGTEVQLPSKYILPQGAKQGLVLNIPEMRMYHYFRDEQGQLAVETFPLGIGREGWATPYITTKIIEKKKNPSWRPPKSILKEHAEAGDPLPAVVKAGPDNPLGAYAMRLGLPQYLIHGTNKPFGIGMRVSHGCIRLYPEDIERLFNKVKVGTRVEITNQPYKVGERAGVLYLEAHPFLVEDKQQLQNNLTPVIELIIQQTREDEYAIDWDKVRSAARNPTGIPEPIGIRTLKTAAPAVLMADFGGSSDDINASSIEPDEDTAVTKSTVHLKDVTARATQSQENKLQLQLDMVLGQ